MADCILWAGIFGAFLLILSVGGFIADYIFPLIHPLNRWINERAEQMEDWARRVGA